MESNIQAIVSPELAPNSDESWPSVKNATLGKSTHFLIEAELL